MNSTYFKRVELAGNENGFSNEIIGLDSLKTGSSARRITELDGLRGIAILMVISFHYLNNQLVNAGSWIGRIIYKATSFGWVGVDLFFVLSGFLIGTILIRNKGAGNYFSTFYMRRIVRIIPNYYLLILVFMIVRSIPFFTSDYFIAGNQVIPVWAYLLMVHNIFIARLFNFGTTSISITWSIGVEEQFYIVFPFLVFLLREKWLPLLLGIAIVAAPLIRMQYDNWIPAYVLLPCRMDSIAFGALVAYLNHHYSLSDWVKRRIGIIAAVLLLDALICVILYVKAGDLGVFRNTLFAILFTGMLVFALVYKDSLYGRILRVKQLVWIGTISYSLYLFHSLILGMCKVIANSQGSNVLENAKGIGVTGIAFFLSIVFSWAVFRKLESPFVNFGKRFKYHS